MLGVRPASWVITAALFGLCLAVACVFQPMPAGADGAAQPAADASDTHNRRAQALSRSVMSPFCPGKTVAACPSPNAQEWRDDIRQWVSDGASNDEIRQRLEARAPGFDLYGRPGGAWGWGVPLFGVALASLWLGYMWRRARALRGSERGPEPGLRSSATAAATPSAVEETPMDVRLREELESFE